MVKPTANNQCRVWYAWSFAFQKGTVDNEKAFSYSAWVQSVFHLRRGYPGWLSNMRRRFHATLYIVSSIVGHSLDKNGDVANEKAKARLEALKQKLEVEAVSYEVHLLVRRDDPGNDLVRFALNMRSMKWSSVSKSVQPSERSSSDPITGR